MVAYEISSLNGSSQLVMFCSVVVIFVVPTMQSCMNYWSILM